jgi:hypothetical protein
LKIRASLTTLGGAISGHLDEPPAAGQMVGLWRSRTYNAIIVIKCVFV